MKITKIGSDYVIIDENSLKNDDILSIPRIHLIKFNFLAPTREKVEGVLQLFNKTNRFVISNNIKFYNDILKHTSKKYYVMNNVGEPLITFLRKNNKVLLNFTNLTPKERLAICDPEILVDVLRNVEVVMISMYGFQWIKDTTELLPIFENWTGNLICE